MEYVVGALNLLLDSVTEADTTALGAVLHIAHLLKTYQGVDGRWPATLNLRTCQSVGAARTFAPVPLFHRLNACLDSTEFESACDYAIEKGYRTSPDA